MKRLRYESGKLDALDGRILDALSEDARLPVAELARRVGLSAPSVAERLRRLEEAGVIEGYGLRINPVAMGLTITAWLRIRPVPGQLHHVAKLIQDQPEIVQCDRITGEDCYIARALLADVAALEKLIDVFMPYAMTNTSVVQSAPVPPRLPVFNIAGER